MKSKQSMVRMGMILVLALVLAACTVEGEDGDLAGTPPAVVVPGTGPTPTAVVWDQPLFASHLLDLPVVDFDDQDLGEVQELLVDSQTGQTQYVVLPGGGILNLGGSVPVPLEAFSLEGDPQVDGQNARLKLITGQYILEDAPTLDPNAMDNPDWDTEVRSYWADQAEILPLTGEGEPSGPPVRVSRSTLGDINYEVLTFAGDARGNLEDLVLSPEGLAEYGLLRTDAYTQDEFVYIPVPWQALAWEPEGQVFYLRASDEFLQGAPRFASREELPQLTRETWDQEVASDWAKFEPVDPGEVTPDAAATPAGSIYDSFANRAAQATGDLVIDPTGAELGTVESFVLGAEGVVEYALVNLHNQEELVPVPFTAFFWHAEEDLLVFEPDPALLAEAPTVSALEGFDPTVPGWDMDIFNYWTQHIRVAPEQGRTIDQRLPPRADLVFNSNVVSPDGELLGVVTQLILMSAGNTRYVVVETQDGLVLVPWPLMQWDTVNNQIVFVGDMERFRTAPRIVEMGQVDVNQPGWDTEILAHWGIEEQERFQQTP